MWYDKLTFHSKQEGLTETPGPDFFTRPLSEEELERYPGIATLYPQFVNNPALYIPTVLSLPEELLQLLRYANGGTIVNGEREFGFFGLDEIRSYYFAYGFPQYLPYFLPIAFNGGGIFYAYDFRMPDNPSVIAVASGNPFAEEAVILGDSLEEVLSKTTDIEAELYARAAPPDQPLNETANLRKQLAQLQQARDRGEIDLKTYLKAKRELESKK
ncbi:SMI1/KNR4 family protein [Taibaiella koreensis]|uniref:SMI1/KNR4 family protein n=1 Tax=Taibaiella koreensis TaxID=1268548 RepID=UPI000E5A042F|nr:SMI1/KNR4 family protein [Taibaiella koreensis]